MITIVAKIEAGYEVVKAFDEAKKIANILGCNVEFDFNGVNCFVSPTGSSDKGAKEYYQALNSCKFKSASN